MSRRHGTRPAVGLVAIVVLGAFGTACGGAAQGGTAPDITITASSTAAPRPTTTTAAPRRPVTTTVAPTTTLEPLPQPVPPPPEGATEPLSLIGSIELPTLGVSKYLFEGITIPTLDNGPGHWPGTAMPGEPGNVVIAGHRTSKDRPFRHIDQLVAGDPVVVTTPEGRYTYRVLGTMVVDPTSLWITTQTREPHLTLFACHPPGSVRERLVVYAELES